MQHRIFDCKLQNKESSFRLGWPKSRFHCFLVISCDLRRAFVVRRKCAHLSVLVCSFGKGGSITTRGFYLSRPHMHSKQVMSPLRELQSLWGLAVSRKLEINQKFLVFSNKIPINEWGHSSCLKYLIKCNSFLFIVIIFPLGAYRQYSQNQCHLNYGSTLVSVLPHLDLDYCSNTSGQLLITCQCLSSHTVLFIYHCSCKHCLIMMKYSLTPMGSVTDLDVKQRALI